ncbi:MAG: hypothetical protein ACYCTH_00075 [Cellulomonas sp.]
MPATVETARPLSRRAARKYPSPSSTDAVHTGRPKNRANSKIVALSPAAVASVIPAALSANEY